MAELATIARPYADALFRAAQAGKLAAWTELVDEMAQVAAHPDVTALVQNPKLSGAQKADIFLSLLGAPAKNEVAAQAANFVGTLTEYDRLSLLPQIAEQFHALKNAQEGAADAQIFSAFEMSQQQVSELTVALEKKFNRKLHSAVIVDSSLIGGVRVVVGDQVLDTSVRAKLQQMHTALTA